LFLFRFDFFGSTIAKVVWVDDWTETTIAPHKLKEWLNEWRHFFEIKALRDKVVVKLYADYWWKKVEEFF
jgi:hypothetical protein